VMLNLKEMQTRMILTYKGLMWLFITLFFVANLSAQTTHFRAWSDTDHTCLICEYHSIMSEEYNKQVVDYLDSSNCSFFYGTLHGEFIVYDSCSIDTSLVEQYQNGELTSKKYYRNRKLISESKTSLNDEGFAVKRIGTTLYENGETKAINRDTLICSDIVQFEIDLSGYESMICNYITHGTQLTFYSDGNIKAIDFYNLGEHIGETREFTKDGRLKNKSVIRRLLQREK
jgi:hypothetical protein